MGYLRSYQLKVFFFKFPIRRRLKPKAILNEAGLIEKVFYQERIFSGNQKDFPLKLQRIFPGCISFLQEYENSKDFPLKVQEGLSYFEIEKFSKQ